MDLCDSVKTRLLWAQASTLMETKGCVQSLTLLAAYLETPPAIGREELLRLGVSKKSINEHLAKASFEEPKGTGDAVPFSLESEILLDYAKNLAQHHAFSCADERCLLVSLLTKKSKLIDAYFDQIGVTAMQLHELRAYARKAVKSKASDPTF